MKLCTVFVFLSAFGGALGQTGGVMGLCSSFVGDVQKCTQELPNDAPEIADRFRNPAMFLSVGQMTKAAFEEMCKPAYRSVTKKYIDCIYDTLRDCLSSEYKGLLPSTSNVDKSMDYLCENYQDVDMTCFVDVHRQSQASQCTADLARANANQGSSTEDVLELVCSIFPSGVACMRKAMETCPGRTAKVMEQYMLLQVPQACRGCASTATIIVPLLCFLLAFFGRKE